ncbi:heme ABC transporter substrate-binding protein IsdE [Robertmurraya sp. 2P01SA]|uniref:heme ABC transporter substrate-binding protein IsdE n=1 Tax=Robertmurraya TaxID=2837507 RepID=UPI0039A5E45B
MKHHFFYYLSFSLLLFLSACTPQLNSSLPSAINKEKSDDKYRIVSTTVAITEIIDALEIDLVGIPTTEKTLPERYAGKTEVGFVKTPDLEIIKYLKPTDVLNVSTLEYDLKPVYEEANIDASFLNLNTVDNMLGTIEELGMKFEREEQAEQIVAEIEDKVADVQAEVEVEERPTVLILLGIPGSYLVATENSYIGDLVKLLGGVNIVQGEEVEYVASNTEYLQQANPDVILRAAHGMPEEVVEMFDQEFRENDIWKHFNAVQNGRVYDLKEEIFGTTASLGVKEAIEELKHMLYEESSSDKRKLSN